MPIPCARNAGLLILLVLLARGGTAPAQAPARRAPPLAENPLVELRYGSIVKGSFLRANMVHRYTLRVRGEGDRVTLRVRPAGETLFTCLALFDPAEILVDSDPGIEGKGRDKSVNRVRFSLVSFKGLPSPTVSSGALAAKGLYTIEVFNGPAGGVGTYQLLVEATLPNNKVIRAGDPDPDAASPAEAEEDRPAAGRGRAAPEFSGTGFPGLPPVDFSTAVTNDLPEDGKIRGKIASDKDNVVRGYTYTPGAGGACEVSLKRTKGSGALGLVILSETNEVLAQASLLASDQVATKITFPAGAATLGVFRLDLKKGAAAGATEFELRVEAAGRR